MRRDAVTPEIREAVLLRDGRCVLSMWDLSHQCYTAWGDAHASDDLDKLQVEHVKRMLMMGRRAPSDLEHLVALCGWRNVVRPMTKVERSWTREYLMRFVPKEAA